MRLRAIRGGVNRNRIAHTSKKELDATELLDLLLVLLALSLEICCIAVEDVHIFGQNVYVFKEILPHECMVALRVVSRESDVLVHVECHHVLERNDSSLEKLDKLLVCGQRGAPCA